MTMVIAVALCQAVLFAIPPLPGLDSASSSTQPFLEWARNAVEAIGSKDASPAGMAQDYAKMLEHLDRIPAEVALQNHRFHADLQQLRQLQWRLLYALGENGLKGESDKLATADHYLKTLRMAKAPQEYELPFLAVVGDWKPYYRYYREVMEKTVERPDSLDVFPGIPPVFHAMSELESDSLLDVLAIVDLCKQRGWTPEAKVEAQLLLDIADAFEKQNRANYAITALGMIENSGDSPEVQGRLSRLRQMTRRSGSEELY